MSDSQTLGCYGQALTQPDGKCREEEGAAYIESPKEKRGLLLKIDFRVTFPLFVLFLFTYLDKVNIGNAYIFGLTDDLHLKGVQFNIALFVLIVPLVVFEIPSNLILRKIRPFFWLSCCMLIFGIVTTLQGSVQNFGGLVAARFFLGLSEAAIIPGANYIISSWYLRSEVQKRYVGFYMASNFAGAFGGLAAFGIGNLGGVRGLRAWRWIFILEGVATVIAALLAFVVLPGFPEQTKWLTSHELSFVQTRLAEEQGSSLAKRRTTLRDIAKVVRDPRVLLGGMMFFAAQVCSYSVAYFQPAIILDFGYSAIHAQALTVPPLMVGVLSAVAMAILSDRLQRRFPFVLIALCFEIVGFGLLLGAPNNPRIGYSALFLLLMGITPNGIFISCWVQVNLGGQLRRVVGTAWQVGFGTLGAIVAPFPFLDSERPRYVKGYRVCIGFCIFETTIAILYLLLIRRENRRRSKRAVECELSVEEKELLGDLSPDFRYMF